MWSRTERAPVVPLALLVLVATAARAVGLNSGLWIDEIYSLVRSFRAPLGTILTEYWGDNHHPFYAVLAHVSRAAFGESAWSVRLPALVFGVAAVPMVFALGRLVMTERESLLASALLAVSYHHVWFSQNARGYSAIALFTLVTMWAMLRIVDGEDPKGRFVALYAVAAGLGAYTHLTLVLVVLGQALAFGVWWPSAVTGAARRTIARRGLAAFALAAAVTLALYAPMLGQVVDFFLHRPSNLKGVSTPSWAAVETVRVLVLGLGAGLAVVGMVVVAVGAVVGVSGLATLWRRNRLFVLMLAGATLVTIAGAGAARGTMYPRFFFFAIGPAMLIVVRGGFALTAWLASAIDRPSLGDRLGTWGVAAVCALSAVSLTFDYRYPKQDFEGAMRFILANRSSGDQVVTTGLPAGPYQMLYGQTWPDLSTITELDSVRARGTRTWVVWTFPRYLERYAPGIERVLHDECEAPRVFRGTVGGGDVLVCALNPK